MQGSLDMNQAAAGSLRSPGMAFWTQRAALADASKRLHDLIRAVGRPGDLTAHQWATLFSFSLDFKPDLILELGRGYGNSTCVFTEVANRVPGCRVVSVCLSNDWSDRIGKRVKRLVPSSWTAPLDVLEEDICSLDFSRILEGRKRVFLFWDAHGYDIAEWVLGEVLPRLADVDHLVAMHDILDPGFLPNFDLSYRGRRLWRGNAWDGPDLVLGELTGSVEQLVSIVDFTSRNKVILSSADTSLQTEILTRAERVEELDQLVGEPFFDRTLGAYWIWFSLQSAPGPVSFPRFEPPDGEARGRPGSLVLERLAQDVAAALGSSARLGWSERLRIAAKLLIGRYGR